MKKGILILAIALALSGCVNSDPLSILFIASKGKDSLYPAEPPATNTRHTVGKGTTVDG